MLFFFLDGDGDHRDLHSFPTRRSSDLLPARYGIDDAAVGKAAAKAALERRFALSPAADDKAKRRSSAAFRSEEHTSELQSRQYLVCRLLLEKKTIQKDQQNVSATEPAP